MPITDYPSPDTLHPAMASDGTPYPGTVFLRAAVNHPRMTVGEYTYASAFDPPSDWAARLAPYLFDFSPETLSLGKFCQIADGVRFITASANHRYDGISSFPFAIFGGGPMENRASMPAPGKDTIIGHDVWIGQGATILPGAQIGNGAIVGAGAVVGGTVPDYAILGGNPAQTLRHRFSDTDISTLNRIAWWDWPIEKILLHEAKIAGGDVAALAAVSSAG